MKIILFHLEILEVRRPKYKKEKALIQQGFPKIKSPFFDKNVRKTDFVHNTIDAKRTLLIYCIAFQVDSRDIAIIPANDHFQGRESVCIIAESFRQKLL